MDNALELAISNNLHSRGYRSKLNTLEARVEPYPYDAKPINVFDAPRGRGVDGR
jgi:hypothetical protein